MLSPRYINTTRAVIDAMVLQDGAPKVREWHQANAKAAQKGEAPVPLTKALGDDVSGAALIMEAYRLGKTASDAEMAELERRRLIPPQEGGE